MNDAVKTHFAKSQAALTLATNDNVLLETVQTIADEIAKALAAGHKLLIAGNGGSAADAQHIAAEIMGRYKQERAAWPAIALTTDTSALTAIGNDYGFDKTFARQVEGLGMRGDVLLALSTSGRSPNITAALQSARKRGLVTIGFTGSKGDSMRVQCDHVLIAPSDDTPIIQQIHMVAAHAICDAVERMLVDQSK